MREEDIYSLRAALVLALSIIDKETDANTEKEPAFKVTHVDRVKQVLDSAKVQLSVKQIAGRAGLSVAAVRVVLYGEHRDCFVRNKISTRKILWRKANDIDLLSQAKDDIINGRVISHADLRQETLEETNEH